MPVEQVETSPGVYTNVKGSADGNMFGNSQLTTLAMAARGLVAQVSGYGTLRVSVEPGSLLNETFESALDTVLRWNATGTVPPTAGAGLLVLGGGTTASATSILTSQPTFPPTAGFLIAGSTCLVDAAKIANINQNVTFGFAVAAAPTAAAPIDNGYVWERDTGGDFNCCVFVGGVRYVINSTNLANITAAATIQAAFPGALASTLAITTPAPIPWPGGNHTFLIAQRGDLCYWYLDSFDVPVAVSKYIAPNQQVLPLRVAKINAAASVAASVNSFSAMLVADSASQNQNISDPTNPWFRAGVGPSGALKVEEVDSYVHIATATGTLVKTGAGALHKVCINSKGTVASIITVYDGTSAAGAVIAIIDSLNLSGDFNFDVAVTTGIFVTTTGTVPPDVTVTYR